MAIFFICVIALFIGLLFTLMVMDSDPENDEPNRAYLPALETLYLGLKPEKKNEANVYLVCYALRRAIYAIVVVLMGDYPAL